VIGRELAKSLHVYVGDEITLVSPLGDWADGPDAEGVGVFACWPPSFTAACTSTTPVKLRREARPGPRLSPTSNKTLTALEIRLEDAEKVDAVRPLIRKGKSSATTCACAIGKS